MNTQASTIGEKAGAPQQAEGLLGLADTLGTRLTQKRTTRESFKIRFPEKRPEATSVATDRIIKAVRTSEEHLSKCFGKLQALWEGKSTARTAENIATHSIRESLNSGFK